MKPFLCVIFYLLIAVNVSAQENSLTEASFLEIQYSSKQKTIDGKLEEWENQKFTLFYITDEKANVKDSASISLNWDAHYLYGAFKSFDQNLIKEEEGISNEYIWRNDGFEIYIDPKYNQDSIMDMNDLNIICDLKGDYTIYTSTEARRENSIIEVPKAVNKHEYYFESASVIMGTINDTSDIDLGYHSEFKIPWALMGIIPNRGDSMRIDICANDLDVLTNSEDWRSYHTTPNLFYQTSWTSSLNFGFPLRWKPIRLIGQASWLQRINLRYPSLIFIVGLCLFLGLLTVLYFQIRKHAALQEVLQKSKIRNSLLIELIASKEIPTTQTQPKILMDAQAFLLANLSEAIKPTDLAKALNLSLRQFQRICKEEIQTTPAVLINLFKIEQAAELLKTTGFSIKEIAYKVGYNDPKYFSKVFKKYFDQTPSEYQDS